MNSQPLTGRQVDVNADALELDIQAERSVSRLRLLAATLVGSSSLAILFGSPSTFGVVVGLLGLGASVGWVVAFRRSGARVRERDCYFLQLDDRGLRLARGGEPRELAWSEVRELQVDEERLVVVLQLRDGQTLDIPPIFRGYGLYEIEDLLKARLRAASTASHG
ncbi:MAG: hypothetical protein GXP55_19100 [Deltaproteobacteria bacterium]|nr:hypothetical protein [Deltaproteobacteria bacterium]